MEEVTYFEINKTQRIGIVPDYDHIPDSPMECQGSDYPFCIIHGDSEYKSERAESFGISDLLNSLDLAQTKKITRAMSTNFEFASVFGGRFSFYRDLMDKRPDYDSFETLLCCELESLYDEQSLEEQIEFLTVVCDVLNIPYLDRPIRGHSQGDYADCFIMANKEFWAMSGEHKVALEEIPLILESYHKDLEQWMFDATYGVILEERKLCDRCGYGEWEEKDSVWGNYLDDDGEEETAKRVADEHFDIKKGDPDAKLT